ncbi:MAG: GIY-YIG nuclease family protein, partial [Bacteroidales bacterium]|nr:GIY-YIG nuclease family protein [Bacteroidales bacterium]
MHYVYILQCSNGKTYTGCTSDLKARMKRHHDGHVPSTKNLRPLELITYFAFRDK